MSRFYGFLSVGFVLLLVMGCGGGNRSSFFLSEGERCTDRLISLFNEVQSLQDLFEKQEELTLLFDRIAQLSIEARTYQLKTKTTLAVSEEFESKNQELKQQFVRILQIPGAHAFLERCQAAGFEKVYTFEMRNSKG